jgi:hypothetical protein
MVKTFRAKSTDSEEDRRSTADVYRAAAQLLGRWIVRDGIASLLEDIRSSGGQPYLLAGAVRDAIRAVALSKECSPKDYDIGVASLDHGALRELGRRFDSRLNRSGGHQILLGNGVIVDLWNLSESAGVKVNHCRPSVRNVLRTFVLDVNAVAFDDSRCEIFDLGCLAALRSRRIGILRSALLHSHSNFAARAMVLKSRLDLELTSDLKEFVVAFANRDEVRHQFSKSQRTASTLGHA